MAIGFENLVEGFNGDLGNFPASYGGPSVVSGRGRVPSLTTGGAGLVSQTNFLLLNTYLYSQIYPAAANGGSNVLTTWKVEPGTGGGNEIGVRVDTVNNIISFRNQLGYSDPGNVDIAYSATNHAWVRVREASGTVYWDTSADGTTWTNRRTASTPTWVSTSVSSLFSYVTERTGGTNNYAEIDNINTGGTTTPAGGGGGSTTVPSVPTNVTATRDTTTPTTINVSWAAPTSTGGSAITGYRVTLDGGAPLTGTSTTASYNNVSNATHVVAVVAINSVGDSQSVAVNVPSYTPPTVTLPLAGTLTDTFTTTLDTAWVPSSGVGIVNGALTFPAPTANVSSIYRRVDFRNQSAFFKFFPVTSSGVTTGFFVRSTADRTQQLRIFVRNTGTVTIFGAYQQGGTDPNQSGRTYNATNDAYWRIRHNSSTGLCYLETSADANTWTALARSGFTAPTWLADVELGIELFA